MSERSDRLVGRLAGIVGALVVLSMSATTILVTSESARRLIGIGSGYVIGQQLDTSGFYRGADHSVVVFARSTCNATIASMSALRELAEVAAAVGAQFVVIPTAGWSSVERSFVVSIGLSEANVRREPVESLRVRVVPSVVIADRGGRIRYVHEGTLLGLNVREIEALLASR